MAETTYKKWGGERETCRKTCQGLGSNQLRVLMASGAEAVANSSRGVLEEVRASLPAMQVSPVVTYQTAIVIL